MLLVDWCDSRYELRPIGSDVNCWIKGGVAETRPLTLLGDRDPVEQVFC
jgi:hypothetical protein